MGESSDGIIGVLIAGLLYAIFKLGDEFVVVLDNVLRAFEGSLLLRLSIDEIFQVVAEAELSIETIVLGLLAIFLILAIVDYGFNEM